MQCENLTFIVGKERQPWNRELERVRGPGLWEWLLAQTMESLTFRLHSEKPWGMLSRDYSRSPCGLGCTQSLRKGVGGKKWPTSTGHAEIQGPGMRNWQVAEDPGIHSCSHLLKCYMKTGRRMCWLQGSCGGNDRDTLYTSVKLSKTK